MNETAGRATLMDRREMPAYPLAEAARYVHLAPATLRSWVVGRPYPKRAGKGFFKGLIKPSSSKGPILSFNNLIEAHVLRALRTEHGVPIKAVRDSLRYAELEFGIERLLLRPELRASAGDLFLERYGELVNLSKSGQLAMKKVLETYLRRVEWNNNFPIRLYPFVSRDVSDRRRVVIDPEIAFGRPIVAGKSISTAAIVERIDAGESIDDIALDYDISRDDIEEAVLYERAA
jgi:uncharacterized protein (DUF433 family)